MFAEFMAEVVRVILKEKIGTEGCNPSPSTTCEETSNFVNGMHWTCGRPAMKTVYHRRDNKSYAMCDVCAYHNINNRDGLLVDG